MIDYSFLEGSGWWLQANSHSIFLLIFDMQVDVCLCYLIVQVIKCNPMYLFPSSFFCCCCSFIIRVTSKMFCSDTLRRILNWNQDSAAFYHSISAENIFVFSVALELKSSLIQQLIKSSASSSCILPSLVSHFSPWSWCSNHTSFFVNS